MIAKKVTYQRVNDPTFGRRVERIAVEFSVAGYVQRLPGNRVELVAQGGSDVVRSFFSRVERVFARSLGRARAEAVSVLKIQGFINRH